MRAQEFDNPKEKFVEIFQKFLPLAMEVIGLRSLPNFEFDKNLDTDSQPSFGMYSVDNETLYIALANRHPNDILRTVAHELVHYKQDIKHELDDMSGATGSPEENEANALAGIVMRNFNKRYPEYLKTTPIVAEERRGRKIKRAAYGPGPYGWYGYDAGYSGDSGSAESAGDRGDIPTGPGEQLIPFPPGTTMVDVSDVYDWYKLGMVISDLDDADPKMFGQGAPHTVIAFGSEEEEHKLLPLLKRLGLSVHDIDRPEDVKQAIPAKMLAKDLAETIRKVRSQYRLVSKSGKNLGTYPSKAGAEKRERQVQYFKHVGESTINIPISELSVNRNPTVHKWQLRSDSGFKFIEEVPNVILQNVRVAIDHESYDNDRKIFAYLQGKEVNSIPQGLESFPIGYQRNVEDPFIDKNTGKPIENVDYVEFTDQGKVIGYKQGVAENFADGRNPQDKGDSAKHGIRKGMTIAQLKKIRSSDSASPRKKQLAHWQINMRQGRKK